MLWKLSCKNQRDDHDLIYKSIPPVLSIQISVLYSVEIIYKLPDNNYRLLIYVENCHVEKVFEGHY
jgi:hypothetical protein